MTNCDTRVKKWLADEVAKLQSESQKEDWLKLYIGRNAFHGVTEQTTTPKDGERE